jgi:16S rRNA (cytosine1402-N4)-methyltransferase
MSELAHKPVMLREVLAALAPKDGKIYVDGTFGGGGFARALLEAAACRVYGIDRDSQAALKGRERAAGTGGRLCVIEGRFGDMEGLLAAQGVVKADGVALDLGVSSFQLDDPSRGFSFLQDGPLDMRMDMRGPSAADLVNRLDEGELARIIRDLGEERRAKAVAKAIVRARPIRRTRELAEIVASVVAPKPGQHPATRTFQALRIKVNDELGELKRGLRSAERILNPGGRLAVLSFHSLEDRIVKQFLVARAGKAPAGSRHLPPAQERRHPSLRLLFAGAKRPSAAEVARNPRARSARLRAAERLEAPPWPDQAGLEAAGFDENGTQAT